jgi:predicted nucleic acid-binding protein
MRIFLDANVLVSVLNKEYPLFTYSSRILSMADKKGFEVYTSPICLAIAFYFAEKKSGTQIAKAKIELLVSKIKIADATTFAVKQTIQNKKINDFEDGLEYYSALESQCQVIVTEDLNDFYFAEIEILNCKNFILKVTQH